ncbi:MAG: NADPH:quinone oxidoreductase family protein [Cyclobacteriaceae bacterium]|nr:NADPH:quinone oxidoreductase family protein [Cyclobacteriaceae bacterium]
MKAVLVTSFGSLEGIQLAETARPVPKDDEVLIRVHYAGVNYPDVLIVKGLYQFRPELPFSPGGEVAGVVAEAGQSVTHFRIGSRVVAANGWGGFAEYLCVPATNCFELPATVPLREASVLLETYATACHALKDRAQIRSGERLLVVGAAGGTGVAAIQLGKLLGAEVIAAASTDEKLEVCQQAGADHLINYEAEGVKEKLRDFGGIDVVFDPVGGRFSETAFRSLRPGGRHLVVGFASGQIPSIPWNLPLLKSASIVGVFWGGFWRQYPMKNRENVAQLIKWMEEGKIKPELRGTYFPEEVSAALRKLDSRESLGKSCVDFTGSYR